MGDIADWANETGLDAACYEQDILDRGDPMEMYEAGLTDEQGGINLDNPPGLIGFARKPRANVSTGTKCPECSGRIVKRTNSHTGVGFLGCSRFPKCRFSL